MKNLALVFFFSLMLNNCDKNDSQPCEDIMQSTENNLSDARQNLCGKWKLTDYFAFRSLIDDPNLKIEFSKGKAENEYIAEVKEDDKSIGNATFQLEETINLDNLKILKMTTNKTKQFSNARYNFLFGEMRICKNKLLIDNGMIFDAPGYVFDKE